MGYDSHDGNGGIGVGDTPPETAHLYLIDRPTEPLRCTASYMDASVDLGRVNGYFPTQNLTSGSNKNSQSGHIEGGACLAIRESGLGGG